MENIFDRMMNCCNKSGWNDFGMMNSSFQSDPIEILKMRLAKGDITSEEYDLLAAKVKTAS